MVCFAEFMLKQVTSVGMLVSADVFVSADSDSAEYLLVFDEVGHG